ncbi:MAG TPA: sensor histidine kinase N-terminal domain-containing protein [Casimicrobiaceae bacterium]|nr:sensor histidine kinase N-terminal domain-containing protein [Casimicrobiaceae bacterium]
MGSIQRRMLWSLTGVLLALVGLTSVVTYLVAYSAANDAYDHSLLDPVMDIVQNVNVDSGRATLKLTPREQEALMFDGSDRVFFQVRDPGGRWFAGGTRDIPAPPEALVPRVPHFYSATVADAPVRICALLTDAGVQIFVAETTRKRDRLAIEIILMQLIPTLLVVTVAFVLVWLGVSHGLAPLRRLGNELQQRSPSDLQPFEESQVPTEVRPAVAALNRLFQRIRETSESQRRFLADAAHQLRTPLAGLQMQLELELREPMSERLGTALGKMRDAVLRTGRVTNRLLALARAEQLSQDPQRFASIDLRALSERIGAQWVPAAIAHGIDLGFDLAGAEVVGDEALLGEMLGNLIDNALRYTPSGGTVTVRCGEACGRPFIGVEDSGIGVPEDEREKVFRRFYRGKRVGGDGSGLGLSIVKEGADRHEAVVTIGTPASGVGTYVTVVFASSLGVAQDNPAAACQEPRTGSIAAQPELVGTGEA